MSVDEQSVEEQPTAGPRYLCDPADSFSQESFPDVAWAETDAFAVGDLHIGIRASTEEFRALIARFLAAQRAEGLEPSANFSVLAADPAADGEARHVLYRGTRPLVQTASTRRLLAALASHLDAFDASAPKGSLALTAVGLVREGRAVVLPTLVRKDLPLIQDWLGEQGIQVVDAPELAVDVHAMELVVSAPGLAVDWPAVAEAARDDPGSAMEAAAAPGRYPLAGWVLGVAPQSAGDGLTPVLAMLESATWLSTPLQLGAQGSLDALTQIFTRLPPVGIHWSTADELTTGLATLW